MPIPRGGGLGIVVIFLATILILANAPFAGTRHFRISFGRWCCCSQESVC